MYAGQLRPTLLVVDDDRVLQSVLARRLRREGFVVETAASGPEALERLAEGWPALVIVDLMMPGMDGFELSRRIKAIADLPIIVLSAVDSSEAKVGALERYAEDYVTKPFDPDELVARVQRVLRRASDQRADLRVGDLEIDFVRRQVTGPAGPQALTRTETRLLSVLGAALDRVVPTDRLLERVWSESDAAEPSYVWVTVRRLRRKLEADPDRPRYLLTERGVGYQLSSGSAITTD